MTCVALPHRSLVRIAGPDAQTLLQDVISCDVDTLPKGIARLGALLTPQGKILFEFLISRDGEDGFVFDMITEQIPAFIQRMTLYRLRAKAEIAAIDDSSVNVCWGGKADQTDTLDERFKGAEPVHRVYRSMEGGSASIQDYDQLRIENGVAEAGRDFDLSDAFPHDVLMDLNGGISLKKGCYVGQEVVSRMQHRGTARRRIMKVSGEANLPATGTSIAVSERAVGAMGTVVGSEGLALVRADKIARASADGQDITADGMAISLAFPSWTGLNLASFVSTQSN